MDDDPQIPEDPTPPVLPPPVNSLQPTQLAQPQDAKSETLKWIFVGPNGIRAGWSLLIYFAIMALTLVPIGIVLVIFHPDLTPKTMTPTMAMFGEAITLFMVLVPTVVMAVIERKSILSYGFLDKRAPLRFFGGFLIGFFAISLLMGLLACFHLVAFDRLSLTGVEAIKYAALWGLSFFLVALFEESFFRGYVQYTLTRGLNFWWAGLITSSIFGITHAGNTGENWLGLLQVLFAGLLFILSLRLTGSLLWSLGLHAGWDWAQSYFYGVADSGMVVQGHLLSMHPIGNPTWNGGAAGPEGSPLAVLVEIAIGVGIWLFWRGRSDADEAPESAMV